MVVVRPAEPADAEQVVTTRTRTWRQAYAGIVPDDVLASLDAEADDLVRRMRERWSDPQGARFRTVVAVQDDRVVGFATFGPYRLDQGRPEPVDPAVGEVLAIYVDPDRQGHGYGRALMDTAVEDLRAAGAGEVRLWVLAENTPSRRFYERYGFVDDGERHFYRVERTHGSAVDLPEVRYTLPVNAPAGGRDRR
jgi:ribosomal protein S18 acetylase RimI-like enzyme